MDTVKLTFTGGHKIKSEIGGFVINTDYPKIYGGEGTAPEPWYVFLASLAACQGIHIRNYCDSNNLPYEDIKITLDPIVSKDDPDWFTDFNLKILVPNSFPKEHIDPMINAAKECRVVKHLCVHTVNVNIKVE